MTLALNALQAALYARLTDQVPTKTYDHVPDTAPFPYIVLGEDTAIPFRDKASDGQEITVTLHIWSNQAGKKECKAIMASVYAALDRQEDAIDLAGYTLIELRCEFSQPVPDYGNEGQPDRFTHGVMRFRAIVQDI